MKAVRQLGSLLKSQRQQHTKKGWLRFLLPCRILPLVLTVWAGQSAKATEYTVEMTSTWAFSPKYLQVQVGDIVTWVNHDWTYNYHDSYCPGYWYIGPLAVNASASLTFTNTGTFYYRDTLFEQAGMEGVIIVKPAPPPPPTPATLIGPMLLQDGPFGFALSNLVVGATYVIQASTDLVHWSSIATNVAAGTVEYYWDNEAPAFGWRCYRSWHLR
jgi:plastocyanin